MHDHLGNLYCVRQRFQQAIHHYKKKIHLQKRNNYKPQKIALAYHTLGMLFFLQKNYTRSLLFLYRAKKAVKVYGCTEKLILADIYMGLARIFAIKKAGSRCILHYKSHLREQRKHGMDKYVNMLGGYNCLRDILQGKKAYTQTITSYKNLLAISLKYFHAKSLKIALIYVHLGDMYYAQRHYTPAIRYYIKALNILKKSKNISLFALTSAYRNIAYAFLYAAKYEKALYHAKRKQEIEEKHLPKQDEFKSFTHLLIGTIHEEKSDYHSALNHYLKALESFIYTSGLHHRNLIDVYEKISRVYMYFQAWEEAIHYRKQALHLAKKHLGEYHFRIALNTRVLGFLYSRQDDMPQALKHYHEALHILTKLNMFPQIRAMYERIADIYYNQTNYSEAIGYYKTLATLYRKKDHLIPALVTCYTKMGSAYSRLGIFPKAIALYKKAHHVSFNALGKNHLTTHSTKAVLDLLKMKKAV